MEQLQITFLVLSVGSFLIPLIAGRKERKTLLWMYILMGGSCDVLMIFLKRVALVNITPLANIYVLAEFIILSLYYSNATPAAKKLILSIAGVFAAGYILQIFNEGLYVRHGRYTSLFALFYIILSLYGFYTILKQHKYARIEQSKFFWVNVAILVGFSGKFLVFLFEDFLNQYYKHLWEGIWLLFKILNIMVNTLFAIALTRKDD
jgi:hypothetical protein